MSNFKKGDIVGRKSYNKDVLFEITKIIKTSNNKKIMILKGITERIEADSPEEDLEIINKRIIEDRIKNLEEKMTNRIEKCLKNPKNYIYKTKNIFNFMQEKRGNRIINTGKILHLDGDKRYSEKSMKYYKSLGLNAVVKNVAENRQPQVIRMLLERYEPDVLVLTGHDRNDKKRNRI